MTNYGRRHGDWRNRRDTPGFGLFTASIAGLILFIVFVWLW